MDTSTLKMNRFIIPGIIILLFSFLTLNNSINDFSDIKTMIQNLDIEDLSYLIPVILFSIAYYSFNMRNILWKPFHSKIVNNIKKTFLRHIGDEITYEKALTYLDSNNRRIMNIFYSFIDNDESLKERSNLVRFNGLLWSSVIDITIISLFFWTICLIKWFFVVRSIYILLLGHVFILLSIFFFLLIFVLTNRHLLLSNEQLIYIVEEKNEDLKKKMRGLNGD